MDSLDVVSVPYRPPADFDLIPNRQRRRNSTPALPTQSWWPPTYQHLPFPYQNCIRLLKCLDYDQATRSILATLQIVDLLDPPSFTALSYTWGPPTRVANSPTAPGESLPSCRLIVLDSAFALPVNPELILKSRLWAGTSHGQVALGKNLSDFLLHFNDERFRWEDLPPRDTLLWIDSVCIDQNNNNEKTDQIPRMGDIFSKAQEVLGWLGTSLAHSQEVVWMMNNIVPALVDHCFSSSQAEMIDIAEAARIFKDHSPLDINCWATHMRFPMPPHGDCRFLWESYHSFFNERLWFRRAWIAQELWLASTMRLLLPGIAIDEGPLLFLEKFLYYTGWSSQLWDSSDNHFSSLWQGVTLIRAVIATTKGNDGILSIQTFSSTPSEAETIVNITLATEQSPSAVVPRQVVEPTIVRKHILTPGLIFTTLLGRIRPYESTNDEDKILAISGTASKILQPRNHPAKFSINSGATVEDIYIGISQMIISQSRDLQLLSHVEGSRFRNRKLLPSWVPDFSVQMKHGQNLERNGFNAWLGAGDWGRASLLNGKELVTFAAEIGKFQRVFRCPFPKLEEAYSQYAPFFLDIAASMEPSYQVTGETRLEALLRTALHSPRSGTGSSLELPIPTFLSMLAWLGPKLPYVWGTISKKTVTKEQLDDVLPDWESYKDSRKSQPGLRQLTGMGDSSFFITDTGFIGRNSNLSIIEPSDVICIFERGSLPYIVRKLPLHRQPVLVRIISLFSNMWPKRWSQYISTRLTQFFWWCLPRQWKMACVGKNTFVDECYVHGVMHGELIAPNFRRGFSPISLV